MCYPVRRQNPIIVWLYSHSRPNNASPGAGDLKLLSVYVGACFKQSAKSHVFWSNKAIEIYRHIYTVDSMKLSPIDLSFRNSYTFRPFLRTFERFRPVIKLHFKTPSPSCVCLLMWTRAQWPNSWLKLCTFPLHILPTSGAPSEVWWGRRVS